MTFCIRFYLASLSYILGFTPSESTRPTNFTPGCYNAYLIRLLPRDILLKTLLTPLYYEGTNSSYRPPYIIFGLLSKRFASKYPRGYQSGKWRPWWIKSILTGIGTYFNRSKSCLALDYRRDF
ncbi:hypothetical protein BD410DRAFT_588755 [Rickenella mellea]|uniref:Uncharacterized protein n=1 Tax=Rickenella mellea TaxID=50990 RepID=A0A4Y7PNC3_9AGAM|nr:hypothetical protein BD410DRAFT_588755 [Rickenella mellea]